MRIIQRFAANTAGRDFAVGDVHGHFTKLQQALDAVGFDPAADRLFSVGDLVDRGPESQDVIQWLGKPWFHAVQGNHEDMVLMADRQMHCANGGDWFYAMNIDERECMTALLGDLPLLIEVETPGGLVGLVHADVPRVSWQQLVADLQVGGPEAAHIAAACQWSRRRIHHADPSGVAGITAVVVGHTPLRQPAVLGNVYHIDTAAWMGGHFTLLDLQTLQAHPPIKPGMSWDWEDT